MDVRADDCKAVGCICGEEMVDLEIWKIHNLMDEGESESVYLV